MNIDFTPDFRVVGEYSPTATVEEIAGEIGMFSCSPEFVREHGSPLALAMFNKIPQDFYDEADELGLYPNIDVRVHRLYPSDYPAVPGWHCDGELRTTWDSQPQLNAVPRHRHIVGTMSTGENGVSLTEFITEPLTLTIDGSSPRGTWEQVHRQIEDISPSTTTAQDGKLYEFSSFTLHRAMPATTRGWRLFLRASMWHKPWINDGGVLARQEYVYRLDEAKGW